MSYYFDMAKAPTSEPVCMHDEMCLKRLKRIETAVESIDEAIRGNDKPGMKQQIASLEQSRKLLFAGIATAWVAVLATVGKVLGR